MYDFNFFLNKQHIITYHFKTYCIRIWPSQCSALGQYLTVNKMLVVVGVILIWGKVRFSFAGSDKTNYSVSNSSKRRK